MISPDKRTEILELKAAELDGGQLGVEQAVSALENLLGVPRDIAINVLTEGASIFVTAVVLAGIVQAAIAIARFREKSLLTSNLEFNIQYMASLFVGLGFELADWYWQKKLTHADSYLRDKEAEIRTQHALVTASFLAASARIPNLARSKAGHSFRACSEMGRASEYAIRHFSGSNDSILIGIREWCRVIAKQSIFHDQAKKIISSNSEDEWHTTRLTSFLLSHKEKPTARKIKNWLLPTAKAQVSPTDLRTDETPAPAQPPFRKVKPRSIKSKPRRTNIEVGP